MALFRDLWLGLGFRANVSGIAYTSQKLAFRMGWVRWQFGWFDQVFDSNKRAYGPDK